MGSNCGYGKRLIMFRHLLLFHLKNSAKQTKDDDELMMEDVEQEMAGVSDLGFDPGVNPN